MPIPPREAIFDVFTGSLLQCDGHFLLAPTPLPQTDVHAEGTLIVRYGITFLGKPHLSIVPELLALDYGTFLTGEEAWDFLLHRSNLYPRGDVIGHQHDGRDEMTVIKTLDLEVPFHVLIYADHSATKPLAQAQALIASDQFPLPARLAQYLPRYATLADWQARK